MSKDWIGNKGSTFKVLGASNHSEHEREVNDYYATDPKAIDLLLKVEAFKGGVWENACGEGHLSKRLRELGLEVISTDLIDRGYGKGNVDFLKCTKALAPNIITNPPYKFALEWAKHSIELLPENGKLALFLKIQFLESENRKKFFEQYPPKFIYCFSNRILCGINGDFFEKDKEGNVIYKKDGTPKKMSSAAFYAWYIWEKGYKGDTILRWIN